MSDTVGLMKPVLRLLTVQDFFLRMDMILRSGDDGYEAIYAYFLRNLSPIHFNYGGYHWSTGYSNPGSYFLRETDSRGDPNLDHFSGKGNEDTPFVRV